MRSQRVSVLTVELSVVVACVEEVSTGINGFVVGGISVERRNVKNNESEKHC